jgi:hypothetical protein
VKEDFYARAAQEHSDFNIEAYLAQLQARGYDEVGLEEREKVCLGLISDIRYPN